MPHMNITWYGHSCFKLEAKSRNEDVVIYIDPFNLPVPSLKLPRTISADVVLLTRKQETPALQGRGESGPAVFSDPGEYEIKDIFIRAIPLTVGDQPHIFWIEAEDMAFVHLGPLSRVLDEAELQEIYKLDALFVPVGGGAVLSPAEAAEVVSGIEPRLVIPMHYRQAGAPNLQPVEKFCQAMGVKSPERQSKVSITKKDLPNEETRLVILEI